MSLAENIPAADLQSSAQIGVPDGINLHHLSPSIGTEVLGIDLAQPMSSHMKKYLHALMLERKVLFFRDQDISTEAHMAFCRNWGELEVIDFLPQHPIYPEVLTIDRDKDNKSYENIWHSDVTWREVPSLGSALRSKIVPEVGGDTLFADMYAAYDGLPAHIKQACEGLMAVHSITNSLGVYMDPERLYQMSRKYPAQKHPVIRTHPETGRQAIFVNRAHTVSITGMNRRDSAELLEILYRQADTPEYQCRFRWQPNSIAFWDNRACQHYAAFDYYGQRRSMERVTVVGSKPF